MRTIRLSEELERRLQLAADLAGETVSEFIRTATSARIDFVLQEDLLVEFTDVIGIAHGGKLHGGVGQARQTGRHFTAALHESATSRRRRTSEEDAAVIADSLDTTAGTSA